MQNENLLSEPITEKMDNMFNYNIFLSHSSKDSEIVSKIYESLKSVKIQCYIHENDSQPGDYIVDKITDEIEECDCFVVLYTKNGFKSSWVNQEVGIAHAYNKRIIALVDSDVDKMKMATQVGKEFIHFERTNIDSGVEKLKRTLQKLRRKQLFITGLVVLGLIFFVRRGRMFKSQNP